MKEYKAGDPIYVAALGNSLAEEYKVPQKTAANTASYILTEILSHNTMPDLRKHKKGVYYRTEETGFGEATAWTKKLIGDKYIHPDIGYETGLQVCNWIGLTTQIPCIAEIKTNAVKHRRKLNNGRLIIGPGKTAINAENKRYLQMLDVLEIMDRAPIDCDDPYGVLAARIAAEDLEYRMLLAYAGRYYRKPVLEKLAKIAEKTLEK